MGSPGTLAPLFPPGLVPSVSMGEREEGPAGGLLVCKVLQGPVLSPLLLNIYMEGNSKVRGEASDETQLYISTPARPRDAINVLPQYLRLWIQTRSNRLQLNPSKTKGL